MMDRDAAVTLTGPSRFAQLTGSGAPEPSWPRPDGVRRLGWTSGLGNSRLAHPVPTGADRRRRDVAAVAVATAGTGEPANPGWVSALLRETEGIRLMDMIRLVPGEPTQIPGTRCEVRWDGEREITIYRRRNGLWDLSPLSRPGIVLAWQRLAEWPHLGWWPIVPPHLTHHLPVNR